MTIHQQDILRQHELEQASARVSVPPAREEEIPQLVRMEGAAATPAPQSVPVPVPEVTGHRFLIYKQDPSVPQLGVRVSFIPSVVLNGPTDTRITTQLDGITPVARNINGDFVFPVNSPQFDCAHTFAVARQTLTMYERHLGGPIRFAWNTGGNTERITVHPRAGVDRNAFYSRTGKVLKFFFFTPTGQPQPIFTCRSLDIVAHEMGHAILDGLKPGWLSAGNPPQTGGLHEAFGDLTAVFLTLAQPDQAEALVAITRANLHDKNFLSAVAEEFGKGLGRDYGLRNADNDLKLSQVGNEVHDISQVFTGAIYDILADIYAFELRRQIDSKDPTVLLIEVAHRLCNLLLRAIIGSPPIGAKFVDVANKMLQLSAEDREPAIYRTFIRNRFAVREITTVAAPELQDLMSGRVDLANPEYTGDGSDVTEVQIRDEKSASLRAEQNRRGCCGTMQMPEYKVIDPEKLSKGGPLDDDDILADQMAELRRAFSK
ncbi:hypothetical protein GCM10010191_81180 [Actinomadura vinacea]|uniref:Peptidase M4 domain-containing protein n=1 Tax=Actinomadura vinacea TaxID=115336 RepID=A0ABN3KA42_9ACTN